MVGILCNLFNAFFVAQFDVPAFIATLGMQEIARGIALYYCGGSNILQLGDFVVLGQGTVGPIPIPVIIVFVVVFALSTLAGALASVFQSQNRYIPLSPPANRIPCLFTEIEFRM